jgi:hypothetical protein
MTEKLTPVDVAAEDLRHAAEEMEQAAWREGIDPDGPLGVFVRSEKRVLLKLADTVVHFEKTMSVKLDGTQKLGETELATLRAANELAGATIRQARAAQTNLELQRDTLVARMVENIGPQLAGGVKDWLVLREREYNRKVARRRAAITGAVVVALIAGGYGVRAWQDTDATAALLRCVSTKIVSPTNGEAFCSLTTLLPE